MNNFDFLDNNYNDFLELLDYINNCDFSSNNIEENNKKIPKKNIHKKCEYEKCNNIARYGLIKCNPITCRLHKTILYIPVISQLCKEPDCLIQPSFGYRHFKIEYCKKHSLPNMINLKSKFCKNPGCEKMAYHCIPNTKETFCTYHATKNMIKIRTYKKIKRT